MLWRGKTVLLPLVLLMIPMPVCGMEQEWDVTTLMWATEGGHTEVVERLIEARRKYKCRR